MSDIQQLTEAILQFRDERDWKQYHNPKDLALLLNVEAGELLEAFLWKQPGEADPKAVRAELADVIYAALLLAHELKLDVREIVLEKMEENKRKYPVEKARGSNKKYDEF